MADIPARLKLRTGTLAAWSSANPILAAGEPGYEVDTRTLRIGDGTTAFLSLQRFQTSDGFEATFQPLDDNLTAFSGLTFAANKLAYGTGIGSFALTDITAEARVFLALVTKAQQRTSLELTSAAITPIDTSTNLLLNPTQLPTREAVRGAILATGGPARRVVFTASGTFVKADQGQYPDNHLVLIEAWGGGKGGGNSGTNRSGGAGGNYSSRWVRFVDLPTTIPVAVGAGGAPGASIGSSGGNTTFGTILTAYGSGQTPASVAINDFWLGGKGGSGGSIGAVNEPGSPSGMGGGGGGSLRTDIGPQPPGGSLGGGAGGAANSVGVAPGGGGGANAAGARGEVRVWL